MTEMASVVLDRLPLVGSETVVDAGCGTGRVTELLLERLPRGRVIAVDADPEMIRVARENLGDRADVRQCDLVELPAEEQVDAVFSTATFHWILDHDLLFAKLFSVLRPGGRLVAQCGGRGNISELRSVGDSLASDPTFAPYFENWSPPWNTRDPRRRPSDWCGRASPTSGPGWSLGPSCQTTLLSTSAPSRSALRCSACRSHCERPTCRGDRTPRCARDGRVRSAEHRCTPTMMGGSRLRCRPRWTRTPTAGAVDHA